MKDEATKGLMAEEVQIFDPFEAVNRRDGISGRVDMARSPNSYVAVFQTRPRGGETHIHQHPDSDQILFILRGEVTVEGLSGKYVLKPNQGVLIPAGVHYGFTNETQEDVIFLTIRTESTGGRRVAYVANVPSNIQLKIPAEEISAKGVGRHIYLYAMDRSTVGISALLLQDWNTRCLLRMHCEYERSDGDIIAKLPQRLVNWYKIDSLSESDYRLIPEEDKTKLILDLSPLLRRQLASQA
ncbi:MAG TPA: cupin domain-containing protein [Candidatus Acidoferrales bacterium]|nr:cupin domain-containing protein [Candidatus Acidoferrales bacterium]